MRSTLSTLLEGTLGRSYCVYEVYGSLDIVIRVWADDKLANSLQEQLNAIANVMHGVVDSLLVEELKYFWARNFPSIPNGRARKIFEELLGEEKQNLLDSFVASPIVIGNIKPITDSKIKVFSRLTPFSLEQVSEVYQWVNEHIKTLLPTLEGKVERLSTYLTRSKSDLVKDCIIIKYHVTNYESIEKIPYIFHEKLSKIPLRTDTFLVTTSPVWESDDGPFLNRERERKRSDRWIAGRVARSHLEL